ncbi:MAG: acetyl-CoA carboxylase biotin carboxyl carrier protein [Planctomycetota bacterium]
MIDIRKLKELVRLMVENDLTEIDLRDQEENVTVKRGNVGTTINHQPTIYGGGGGAAPSPAAPATAAPPAPAAVPATSSTAPAEAAPSEDSDEGLVAIESPMVGSFYASPNPDADAFVKVGDSVSPTSTVCLVEAMKVFNEIKAETSGTIEKILVSNGDAVEFGQKLFLIRPN